MLVTRDALRRYSLPAPYPAGAAHSRSSAWKSEHAPMPSAQPAALIPTIFHEPWWLETASNGRHREAQVWADGRLVGRLPYLTSRHFGMRFIGMPVLTHFLGPAVSNFPGSEATALLNRVSVVKDLVRQLPRASFVYFKHHYGISNTVAFQALGFQTETQFTREVAPASPELLWRGMRDKTRNVIRRAEEQLTVEDSTDAAGFMVFYEENLRQMGVKNYYDRAICEAVIQQCLRRGTGRILVAHDESGELQSGIFTVWDHRAEYYLMSTRKTASGNGAVSLLLWQAIQHAARKNLIFDFDGIIRPSDAKFFLGFGGELKPRYITYSHSNIYRFLSTVRRAVLSS